MIREVITRNDVGDVSNCEIIEGFVCLNKKIGLYSYR